MDTNQKNQITCRKLADDIDLMPSPRRTDTTSSAAAIWLLNEAENAELALYRSSECFEYNFLLISFNTLFHSCVSSFCCPISLILFVYTRGKSLESQPTALAVYLYGILVFELLLDSPVVQ
ncbi:hypothetical protein PROFUN_15830 [Planoprotostelium fungivorum]|uniref:Uncharacterized protein n=1 Tax=Planoprotostelium fungivorum TaxID=1890364 RepID=A0A2P6MTA7_9EUKA|nr:hypothetical protein PROFUN_15830 [Planoprotostelium fungivorum]